MSEYESNAEDFLQKHGIKFKATHLGDKCPMWCDGKRCIHGDRHRITFTRKVPGTTGITRRFTTNFWNSYNDAMRGNSVHPYDVLSVITKYDPGTFEEFCHDFGYSTDSIRAKTIYDAVREEWFKVSDFFSEENELDELREIS